MSLRGNAWVFGDHIDTDLLAPGMLMRKPIHELARHCLSAVDPSFAANVQRGDILVAGVGFGMGSSREQAVQALLHLGVACVVAKSVARIFFRNSLNLGLPVLTCPELIAVSGDELEVVPSAGLVINKSTGIQYPCQPIPAELMHIVDAGGLIPYLASLRGGPTTP